MIAAIIQARMRSSRLPGKVLADLAGEPMLARVYNRTRRASTLEKVIVATSDQAQDDPIAALAASRGWPCFRGNEGDCLDRYYQAAMRYNIDPIVRVTGDCPFIDPGVIDAVVNSFCAWGDCDFVANRLPPPWRRTWPVGLDVETCSLAALGRAWREAKEPYERESVMPYLYRSGLFRVGILDLSPDLGHCRWTVDTPEDLVFARAVYGHIGHDLFGWQELQAFLADHPEIERVNTHVKQNTLPVDVQDQKPVNRRGRTMLFYSGHCRQP